MKKVQDMNSTQLAIVNSNALFDCITPAGISLTAVRGLSASYLASSQRLKAIAAERANIMQPTTRMNFTKLFFHATKFIISFPQPIALLRFV